VQKWYQYSTPFRKYRHLTSCIYYLTIHSQLTAIGLDVED